jgi:uncharacterized protein (DUF1501 family)
MNKLLSRRAFLDHLMRTTAGSAAWSAGLLGSLAGVAQASAAADDYKALVCLFFYGGNDAFNWLVPREATQYQKYAQSRPNLAIPLEQLQPLGAPSVDVGLHPSCPGIASLFAQKRAAFVANCGTLMAPTTKDDFLAGKNLPPALFSHNDQQDIWMSGAPGLPKLSGWAGRVDQLLDPMNGSSPLAMNLSLSGNNLFGSGGALPAYILNSNGATLIDSIHHHSENYYPYLKHITLAEASVNPLERQMGRAMRSAFDVAEVVDSALQDTPPPTTPFDLDSDLGRNMRMAAYMISTHALLGVKRQIYFVGYGSFDTHDRQGELQPELLGTVDAAVSAFQAEMEARGLADNVTLFTMSDFGRTLTVNGDGTDHGWGSHHLVVGGAVRGGDIYGRMPDMTLDGPDDGGFGRIIPSTSVDQYAATLASWFGVAAADLPKVFKNLPQFTPRKLGFLGA